MSFHGEPTNDDLTFLTGRLTVRPIDPNDAEEAFELLTHTELRFLDPKSVPPTAAAFAEFAEALGKRTDNDEDFRLYQWSLRLHDSGALVGLVSAVLRRGDRLRAKDLPLEVRELELTVYIHPDHQHVGYGSEASTAVLEFVEPCFEVNRRIAMIRHDNFSLQQRVTAAGATKQAGMSPQGYETWVIYDNVGS